MIANNYAHIASNGNSTLSKAPCVLIGVTINSKGASANILTLYDGTSASAPVIAVIDTTSVLGTLDYDVQCLNGLYAVMGTGTAGDVTVAWA